MADNDNAKTSAKNVFAYTETAYEIMPGYASLNRHEDGTHWLTLRTTGSAVTAGLRMPPEELRKFAESVLEELA